MLIGSTTVPGSFAALAGGGEAPQPAPALTPQAVWENWLKRMGPYLAMRPTGTPRFAGWNTPPPTGVWDVPSPAGETFPGAGGGFGSWPKLDLLMW